MKSYGQHPDDARSWRDKRTDGGGKSFRPRTAQRDRCCVEAQLEHARKAAARIPEIEAQFARSTESKAGES